MQKIKYKGKEYYVIFETVEYYLVSEFESGEKKFKVNKEKKE